MDMLMFCRQRLPSLVAEALYLPDLAWQRKATWEKSEVGSAGYHSAEGPGAGFFWEP